MKTTPSSTLIRPVLRQLALPLMAVSALLPSSLTAATLQWDDNTTTAGIQFMNGNRPWNTSAPGTEGWSRDVGVTHEAWNNANNDNASISFGGNNRTMTLGSAITANSLSFTNANAPATFRNFQFNQQTLTVTSGSISSTTANTGLIVNSTLATGTGNGLSVNDLTWIRLDSASNTINGNITINDGAIRHGSGNDAVYGAAGNRIDLNNSYFYNDRGGFSTSRNFDLTGASGIGGNFSSTAGRDLTLSGVISGSGELNFTGFNAADNNATLELSGSTSNTYAGITRAHSELLELNKSDGAIAIAGNLEIGGGAAGTDTVRLLLGNQIANTSNVTLNSTGVFDLNNFDEIVLSLNVFTGAELRTGLIGGNLTVQSFFLDGFMQNAGSYDLSNYAFITGAGNLIVIPEPSALALLVGGVSMLLMRRRRNAR